MRCILSDARGAFTPTQSYYAVDRQNETSLANNAADNVRALQTNTADNTRALETNANSVRGSTIASLYGALNEGQVRPSIPAEVSATVGLPPMVQAEGRRKPMSETEMLGAIIGRQPAEDRFSPEVLERFQSFNPNLPAIDASRQRTIAAVAAAQNGGAGQVSNRDIERVEAQIGGSGIFANNKDAIARIDSTLGSIREQRGKLGTANPAAAATFPGNSSTATAPASPTSGKERWVRGADGKLQRAP